MGLSSFTADLLVEIFEAGLGEAVCFGVTPLFCVAMDLGVAEGLKELGVGVAFRVPFDRLVSFEEALGMTATDTFPFTCFCRGVA